MNVMKYGKDTASFDWIPERAIGPTEDCLYEAEKDYCDAEVERISGKNISGLSTAEKRQLLMDNRNSELRRLIAVYYAERGWTANGIPRVATLKELGLWDYLSESTKERLNGLQ